MQIALTDIATSSPNDLRHSLSEWLKQCAMLAARPGDDERDSADVEATLITAARHGDEDAFRQIVDRYQSTLSRQMTRFSRDQRVVEDLVHDAFVEAFMSLSSFRGKSPFEHWLRKIAVRVGYRFWQVETRDRNRRSQLLKEAAHATFTTAPPTDAVDARDQLHVMLAQLSPRDRLVLTLLYWDGHGIAEAARLAGWSQTMFKVQAHRARQRLKKLLEKSHDNEQP